MADDVEEVHVVVNAADMARVLNELKKFSPVLSTTVRRRIRNAGKIVLNDVADAIAAFPVSRYEVGMREQLAKSLAVRVTTTPGDPRQGVQIVSTGRLLPAQKKALVKAMNTVSFHHPTFGRSHWMEQRGMRYFGQRVVTKHEQAVLAEIRAALDEAVEAMR